jgi:hypothetical protein
MTPCARPVGTAALAGGGGRAAGQRHRQPGSMMCAKRSMVVERIQREAATRFTARHPARAVPVSKHRNSTYELSD